MRLSIGNVMDGRIGRPDPAERMRRRGSGRPTKRRCAGRNGRPAPDIGSRGAEGETFTFEVDLVLDGERYLGTGTWPTGVIIGNAPSVKLTFTPPLTALS